MGMYVSPSANQIIVPRRPPTLGITFHRPCYASPDPCDLPNSRERRYFRSQHNQQLTSNYHISNI
ncbi:Protein of unknown function [Pyronema omphalodes CBS 100304]|uniref:Uncharacterized protein n=1 Tax=Pyronema omphalodes (strain CBS 100304) TaxID=1076935 RepID=U4KYN4_PYROM|nr:Protein of unknown function [Pyronema omphalodes CBS 100304]